MSFWIVLVSLAAIFVVAVVAIRRSQSNSAPLTRLFPGGGGGSSGGNGGEDRPSDPSAE